MCLRMLCPALDTSNVPLATSRGWTGTHGPSTMAMVGWVPWEVPCSQAVMA